MAGSIFRQGDVINIWTMSICLTIVVAITIVFEGVLHHLESWIREHASDITSEVYMQMLQKLYKELMILGFISFVLTMLLQTDSITDAGQIISFEYAHFVVFFMALSLILQAVAITASAYFVKKRCHTSQHKPLAGLIESLKQVDKAKSRRWFPG
jgi:uncharacterized membrane protein